MSELNLAGEAPPQKAFVGPVTALLFPGNASPVNHHKTILAASAGSLCILRCDSGSVASSKPPVWHKVLNKERIHVLASCPSSSSDDPEAAHHLIVGAGRQLVHVLYHPQASQPFHIQSRKLLDDFVLAASFYTDPHTKQMSALVATAHHSVLRLNLTSGDFHVLQHVHCQKRPLLWSSSFSKSLYQGDVSDVHLVSGSILQEVLLWRPFVSEEVAQTLSGHNGTIFGVALSPSGQCIASCSDDRTVRIWSKATASESYEQKCVYWGHQARVWRVFWVTDTQVASAGEDAQVFLWDIEQSQTKSLHKFESVHDGKSIWSLAVHRESATLATGGADGQVRYLQRPELRTDVAQQEVVKTFASSSDGAWLAYLTKTGDLFVQERNADRKHHGALLHGRGVCSMVYDEVHHKFWMIAQGGQASSVDPKAASPHSSAIELGHVASHVSYQVLPDRTALLLVSDRKTRSVVVYKLVDGNPTSLLSASASHIGLISTMHMCPTSQYLLVGDTEGHLAVYGCASDKPKADLLSTSKLHEEAVTDIFFHSYGQHFETTSRDTTWAFHRLDSASGQPTTLSKACIFEGLRLEKMLLVNGHRYFCCAGQSKLHLIDEAGTHLGSEKYGAATVPQFYMYSSQRGIELLWLQRQSLSLMQVQRMNAIRPLTGPAIGREVLDVKAYQYDRDLLLLASSTEDGVLHISSLDGSGTAITNLFSDRGLKTTAKTLHWVAANGLLLLVATGSRFSRWVYKITILQSCSDNSSMPRIGAVLVSQVDIQEESADDLRIVDSTCVRDEGVWQFFCGCSDGSMRRIDLCVGDLRWSQHSVTEPTLRCSLSVAPLAVPDLPTLIFQGCTDGRLTVWAAPDRENAIWRRLSQIEVHQSGINSLAVRQAGPTVLVISGGDDGQVFLSAFLIEQGMLKHQHSTKGPTSHSSAVRSVSFVSSGTGTVLSAGWDQRLAVWDIDSRSLQLRQRLLADVADVNSLESISTAFHPGLVAVGGVGLQILHLPA